MSNGTWIEIPEVLIFRTKGSTILPKLAAFDFDWTLIKTKSGRIFPVSAEDWRLWSDNVPRKLRSLVSDSYCIALVTNQSVIDNMPGGGRVAFKRRIESVIKGLGVPATVVIATALESIYRKPCTGSMDLLLEMGLEDNNLNLGEKDSFWDFENSFFVGDAAGRVAGWKHGVDEDFACSDRLFAINAGLKFYTPEEFFLGADPAPFEMPIFNPLEVGSAGTATTSQICAVEQEMVIFVGPPVSGKTSFSQKFAATGRYDVIGKDAFGAAKRSLEAGRSVLIDTTNPDQHSRLQWIKTAEEFKCPVRCFLFQVSIYHAYHNERFRRIAHKLNPNAMSSKRARGADFNYFQRKYEEPSLAEGFTDIAVVKFVPEFDNPAFEKLYRSYLVEK